MHNLGSIDHIPIGEGREFQIGGLRVAVFRARDGSIFALQPGCPHRGGPLGEGDLEGSVAVCPWHGWRWDVKTGANANNPAVRMTCFPASVEDGRVYVELP